MEYVSRTPEVGLSPYEVEFLFGNIKEIYLFNRCASSAWNPIVLQESMILR